MLSSRLLRLAAPFRLVLGPSSCPAVLQQFHASPAFWKRPEGEPSHPHHHEPPAPQDNVVLIDAKEKEHEMSYQQLLEKASDGHR